MRRLLLQVLGWMVRAGTGEERPRLKDPQEEEERHRREVRWIIVGAVALGVVLLLLAWFVPEFRRFDHNN